MGRGTSTFDGTAIAGATVHHLMARSQCLTLFATHYHSLLDEWKNEPMVRLGHMQCIVGSNDDDDDDANPPDNDDSTPKTTTKNKKKNQDHSITFLYTLGPGTCPKSFGINVARLASLPAEVLDNAQRVSQEFEQEMAMATAAACAGQSSRSSNGQKDEEEKEEEERVMAAIHRGDWEEVERLWHEMKNSE